MHILAFASQKGGVGKTTLSAHLAVEAERRGAGPVALVDADPQHSLTDWWAARADIPHTPALVRLDVTRLKDGLDELRRERVALVVIDTPPAIAEIVRAAIRAADLVLIPSRPSPLDLRAIGSTVMLAEDAGKPLIFLLNGAAHRARITDEVRSALSEDGRVAKTVLHQRTEIATAMVDGRTVMELNPDGRSAGEVADLWTYVSRQLNRARKAA